ncbi:radical SAM protein [Oscillibacter sp. 1-3]|uniref:radical SAM protein n=1 Tax=Oscillibacter sp. 1-3 TaxID=1235797 RepID=UPI00033B7782|nr:radical SAM protein [Oscillibacter sp. 1-3]EOS64174.1 hypothetical protein C816_03041 [Oscillibacter sp. 1-3]
MEQLEMYQTGIVLTMACNLKCRLCSNYAPYYDRPELYSIDFLKEMMRRYFTVVPHIRKLMVSGGEPLLHPALDELVLELRKYRDQIGTFGIITNGTIVPNEKLLAAVEGFGCHFHFLIDNYGQALSAKAEEIDALLSARGIDHVVRNYTETDPHCGGFIDFGDLSVRRAQTEAEARQQFAKCAYPQKYHFSFDLIGGVMYPCGPCRRCKELGIANDYSEYIDLFDDTLAPERQREKIERIYAKTHLAACAYCDGMCEDSRRFRPAEQLNEAELAQVRSGARFYADIG